MSPIDRDSHRGRCRFLRMLVKLVCKANETQPSAGVTSSRGQDSVPEHEDVWIIQSMTMV